MYLLCLFFCFSALLGTALSQDADSDAVWTTVTLQDPNISVNDSDKAVAVADEGDSFIVAVERASTDSALLTSVLYKVTQSGDLLWTFESQALRGIPFDIAVDQDQGTAYLVVSSVGVDSSYTFGHVVRYSGISEPLVDDDVLGVVSEDIFFTTDSVPGNTKLFGCALNPSNGDLYVTGGTSASLYGEASGRSDVIVVRLSSSGQVLATIQFGGITDEFGRAIDVSADSTTVAVAVHKVLESGGTESVLYRLDAGTLADSVGPQALLNYAATPLYTPADVAISGPLALEAGTVTTVIAGSALTIPDRKTDMFFHLFATIGESESNVAVYVDGVADHKNDDYAVALEAGTDGNFYCMGYSSPSNKSSSNSLVLVVISPTGETVYRTGRAPITSMAPEESATGMTLFSTNSRINVAFVGYVMVGTVKRPTFGLVVTPPDKIPVFKGFGSIVEGAEADSPSTSSNGGENDAESAGGNRTIPIATGAVAGALVLLVGGLGIAMFRKRQPQTTTAPGDGSNSISHLGARSDTIRPCAPSTTERSLREQQSTLV